MSKPHLDRNDAVGNMVMESLDAGFKSAVRQGVQPWFISLGAILADKEHGSERLERTIHNAQTFLSKLGGGEMPVLVLEDVPLERHCELVEMFSPLTKIHPRLRFVCFTAPPGQL